MYGETFYGRHTAQHQLQWKQIKIIKPTFMYFHIILHLEFQGNIISSWNSERMEQNNIMILITINNMNTTNYWNE